jgi:thiamine-phosphate pyrophosphorylase
MKLCYVTDRKALPGTPEEQIRLLLGKIKKAAHAGVDWIQIRERDLDARKLATLVQEAKNRAGATCRILMNDRLDVALAAGAQGVHLGERSLPVREAKQFVIEHGASADFLCGVSAHSVAAVREAETEGADYAVFGPVFATPSKLPYGPPLGVEELAAACRSVAIPVIAIGGITLQGARDCVEAGAAGIAAIRLFQDGDTMEVVNSLRSK